MSRLPRRVVTGHSPEGVSIVVSDGPAPVSRELPEDGVAFHEIWSTIGAPAPIDAVEQVDPTERRAHGASPSAGHADPDQRVRARTPRRARASVPVHRTASIDYGVVLEGEITLVLDDSEVTLYAGDIVVQRGTDHAWANRGSTTAMVAFILVDGAFESNLVATLPDGAIDGLMHAAPRD